MSKKDKIIDDNPNGNYTIYHSILNNYRILKHELNNGRIFYTIEKRNAADEFENNWRPVMDDSNILNLDFSAFGDTEKLIAKLIKSDDQMHGMKLKKTTIL